MEVNVDHTVDVSEREIKRTVEKKLNRPRKEEITKWNFKRNKRRAK